MSLGQKIKKLREERKMTQEQLAKLMGYSHKSSINKIELGKADLPQSKLHEFAKVFNVNPVSLFIEYWDEKYDSDSIAKELKLLDQICDLYGKDTAEILELFTQLNEQGRKKAIDNIYDLTMIKQYLK